MSWFKRRVGYFKVGIYEIRNWFFVRRTIRKHRKTADWQQFNLRVDWIGRIYTVLNPQLPGDKGDTKEVLLLKYAERIKPINLYLNNLGLGLAISVASEEVENSDSLLVVWYPIFEVITFWKVFWHLAFILVFFLTKIDTWTWQGLSYLYNLFF